MKKLSAILMAGVAVAVVAVAAQAAPGENGNGHRVAVFIDENGDGFNDLAPDADGDGIPNGLDSDYVKPQDGTGSGFGRNADGAGAALAAQAAAMAAKMAAQMASQKADQSGQKADQAKQA